MSGLPGRRHPLPDGAMCDEHSDRAAVANVQGETDSFGFETVLLCQECLDADRAYEATEEAHTGTCDWCKREATDLAWARDYEEGMGGPVYRVCRACSDRVAAEARREMDEHDLDYPEADDEPDAWDPADDCGQTGDGTCMNAGSEWCDFECPLRDQLGVTTKPPTPPASPGPDA
ncbi:hypothetical protein MKK84_24735 [Methylobacterium sp. E-065]|uniref:hypothetical protein n=1 Tax=Methylobacterium sp. E-065 TaxID=2836583 RepID=UPI001FB9C997|nr:hypothetical protein [Methylobacterium sp. E-065]MCJ2020596.1 hypothetical protein [Methylobacterium sp. E-065]